MLWTVTKLIVLSLAVLFLPVIVDAIKKVKSTNTLIAEKKVAEVCKLPFLRCETNSKGEIDFKSGSFGVGTGVNVSNNGVLIDVYYGCPTNQLTRECLLPPSVAPLVMGFLKIEHAAAARQNADSYRSDTPSLAKELESTREFSAFNFPDSDIPMGVPVIEIGQKLTRLKHQLQETAYIQRKVLGLTAEELEITLTGMERKSMRDNLYRILLRFVDYSSSLTTTDHSANHASNKAWIRLSNTVNRAQTEMMLRVRLRLHFGYMMIEAIQQLWSMGFLHCDLHWGNIMVVQDKITTEKDLLDIIKTGRGFIPDIPFFYSEYTVVPKFIPRLLAKNGGITVYRFNPTSVRFIDVANLLEVRTLLERRLKNVGYLPPTFPLPRDAAPIELKRAETKITHPCKAYRPWRREDVVDFYEGGFKLLLERTNTSLLMTEAIELVKQDKADDPTSRRARDVLHKILIPSNTVYGNLRHAKRAVALVSKQATDIAILFQDLSESIKTIESLRECIEAALKWGASSTQVKSVTLAPDPEAAAQRIIEVNCSFRSLRDSATKMQDALKAMCTKFPKEAECHFDLLLKKR